MPEMNRVRCVWTGVAGAPWYLNLYSLSGATSTQQALDAARSLLLAFAQQQHNGVVGNCEADVAKIDSNTGQTVGVATGTVGAQIIGAQAGQMPPATQGLVRLLTGLFAGGRQIRGRIYVPGVPTAANTNGLPTLAYRTALQSGMDAYRTTLGPSMIVWSRKNASVAPVASISVWSSFAVLRSRRD